MMAAGHTHRAKRTANDVRDRPGDVPPVDYVKTGAELAYPGGYNLLHLHDGGYMLNFHRVADPLALRWTSRSRWAAHGLNPEYLLGECGHRNYTVIRDLPGLG